MAVRTRQQASTAATTAGILLAAWLSAPAIAAPDRDVLCEDNQLTLDVSVLEFSATPVNNSAELLDDHLLKPRAESAARSAFADDAEKTEDSPPDDAEEEADALDESPVIPSAFGREPSPYKRQMYRRDI